MVLVYVVNVEDKIMKDIKEFYIENKLYFNDLVGRIHQSNVYVGGDLSKEGLRF